MQKELEWLINRGISPEAIQKFKINIHNGSIVIPITDQSGNHLFNKYRKNPDISDGPKYWYDSGQKAVLFNSQIIANAGDWPIIICEGELDCVLLDSKGLFAVSSTGGCGTFPQEWYPLFENRFPFICFDSDDPGQKAAAKLAIKTGWPIIILPKESKDITEYLANHTIDDFMKLETISFPSMFFHTEEEMNIPDLHVLKKWQIRNVIRNIQTECSMIIKYMQKLQYAGGIAAWVKSDYQDRLDRLNARIRRYKAFCNDNFDDKAVNIEKAKQVPIEQHFPGKLKRQGNKLWGSCPFGHSDSTPSFVIYTEQNTFHCYSCSEHGDVINFIMKIQNLKFLEAVKLLLNL